MKLTIQTKRVYAPKHRKDGFRALVMRLWPRGIRMTDVDIWLKDLGPSRPLLSAYRAGKIQWPAFQRRYRAELRGEAARKALTTLAQAVEGKRLTLLCACQDLKRCHTAPLKRQLTQWLDALSRSR